MFYYSEKAVLCKGVTFICCTTGNEEDHSLVNGGFSSLIFHYPPPTQNGKFHDKFLMQMNIAAICYINEVGSLLPVVFKAMETQAAEFSK